ncbi:hypothetical protein [uncultured Modestobacter sp.]|uniref:hypothetical protein n=1 Tax=uncultured Modestobacter sp. TaxID=380048 RepID=UPI002608C84B|nr:hypothetical protein [uncultured Modestobacter sp.]
MTLVVVLLAVSVVLSLTLFPRARAGFTSRRSTRTAALAVEVLVLGALGGSLAALAVTGALRSGLGSDWMLAVVICLGVVAALGGAPVATAVLRLADPAWATSSAGMAHPSTLPGGEWLGLLERLVTFACLALGWPEGVAALLLLKSWGRQEDLKKSSEVGQRFMVGTLASVLWAAACAGVFWAART